MNKYSGFLSDNSMPNEGEMEFFEDVHKDAPAKHVPPVAPAQARKPGVKPGNPYGYGNVVIYEPMHAEDVEVLIDYLRTREPAIVKLNVQHQATAQRILDMVSGAIFALNGSIHPIVENVFLLTPEGVEISAPLK